MPHSMRMVVDLPAPLGPSTPKISPRCTRERHVAHRHQRSPKRRDRCSVTMIGVAPSSRRRPAASPDDPHEGGHAGVQLAPRIVEAHAHADDQVGALVAAEQIARRELRAARHALDAPRRSRARASRRARGPARPPRCRRIAPAARRRRRRGGRCRRPSPPGGRARPLAGAQVHLEHLARRPARGARSAPRARAACPTGRACAASAVRAACTSCTRAPRRAARSVSSAARVSASVRRSCASTSSSAARGVAWAAYILRARSALTRTSASPARAASDPRGQGANVLRPRSRPQQLQLLRGGARLALAHGQRAPLQLGRDARDQRLGRQPVPFVDADLGDPAGHLEPEVALLVFDDPLEGVRIGLPFPAAGRQPGREPRRQHRQLGPCASFLSYDQE